MTILQLPVPYADTSAGMLSYALGLPTQAALGDLVVTAAAGPGTTLTLRLLGASHQALLDTASGRISETVACLDAVTPTLPARVRRMLPVGPYRFAARVHRLGADELRREVDRLRRRLARQRHVLIGAFPGATDAVTALLAEPRPNHDAVRWQTWHVYPQTGEVVHTHSVVQVRGSTEGTR